MRWIAATLVIFLSLSPTRAQDSSALINEAMDKIYPLDFPNTPLPNAMKSIGEQTGVRIEATSSVWELLPWGDQTTLTAKFQGKTLRDALDSIARKLGLMVVLKQDVVELRPMPALTRLGRRSTVQELAAIDLLASTPADLGTDRPTVKQLLEKVDQKLVDLKSAYAIENRAADAARAEQTVFAPRNATLMDALESMVKETRATWYPWGKSIVIVPKEDQIRNQLEKTMTMRYRGVNVAQVLTDLSQRSGVEFTIEPGAIPRIPTEFRTIMLFLDNATVKQALENLSGYTGLGYVVNDTGVYIWNQMTSPTGGARDEAVGLLTLDNGMQLIVRGSELTQEMREYLQSRKNRWVEKTSEMMKEEGFKPSTRPTTLPIREDL
jgi:hypothetical protein